VIDDPDSKALTVPGEVASLYEHLADQGWQASITFTNAQNHLFVELRATRGTDLVAHRWELIGDQCLFRASMGAAA
jgi:hypothetical protein